MSDTTTTTETAERVVIDVDRAEILAEAIEAARGEYLAEPASTDDDEAYNRGVADAIAAIGALTEGGADRA